MPISDDIQRLAIPNALHFEEAPGGLVRAVISTPAATGEIYLHGAHVTQWTPRGAQPVIFLSSKSLFAPEKAIRGGVPVIFPWFGPRGDGKPGPMHGFARISAWTLESTALRDDGAVELVLALDPTDASRALGFDSFHLRFRAAFGQTLELQLETHNTAASELIFQEALHTYFSIGDVRQVAVSGLENTTYIDKTANFARKQQGAEPVRISSETDRVYLDTTATCVIDDAVQSRRIAVEKSGSHTTVVWNPWTEKIKSLSDMAPDEWQRMICVETANAGENEVHLAPGAVHKMAVSIRIA